MYYMAVLYPCILYEKLKHTYLPVQYIKQFECACHARPIHIQIAFFTTATQGKCGQDGNVGGSDGNANDNQPTTAHTKKTVK